MGRATRADVIRLRETMLSQQRDVEDIAGEIRLLTGRSRLAAFRLAHNLTQPMAVERYKGISGAPPMDQQLLSKFELFPCTGSRAPLAAHVVALAVMYGTSPTRLLDPEAFRRLPERERAVLLQGRPIRALSAIASEPTTTVEPTAEIHPQPLTGGDPRRLVQMAARKAFRFASLIEGSNVGPETLDQVHDEIARLASEYPRKPLTELLPDLVEVQDVAFRLLEGRQRPAEAADLYLCAGVLSGMLAKATHDLGDPHSAMQQARTAYVCADHAGHGALKVWVRSLQSMIAFWAGWPTEAVRFASQATDLTSAVTGTAAVWLASQTARAWAVLGNAEETHRAIAAATTARDRVEPDDLDQLGGILTFPAARQKYYQADALVWLPEEQERAEEVAADAVVTYQSVPETEQSFSDQAGAHADLGRV